MTASEIDAFLAEPGHLVRIGTTGADGMPLVVPTWFVHEDGMLLVTPRERSAWLANLRRDPRACFTIDEETAAHRKVVAQGPLRTVHELGADNAWRDVYRRITMRYVPEAFGDAYLADTREMSRER